MNQDLFREEALSYQALSGTQYGTPTGTIPPSWSRITFLFTIFMAALVVFLAQVDLARKETVRGRLRTEGAQSRVYPVEQGIVQTVHVRNGQAVTKGEPIATIRRERVMASGEDLTEATRTALLQEKGKLVSQKESDRATAVLNRRNALYAFEAAVRREKEGRDQQLVATERLNVAEARKQAILDLKSKGLATEPLVNERYEAVAALTQASLQIDAQISAAMSEQMLARTEMQLVDSKLAQSQAQFDQRIAQIEADLSRTEAQAGHTVLAPSTGRLTSLQARPGEVTTPDIPLAIILPADSTLMAEIFVPSRAIGFIETGQQVKLQYDAFPYQKFGTALGTVSDVSNVAQSPNEFGVVSQTGEHLYRVQVKLEHQEMRTYGRDTPLQSGMELSANIILEDRKLLEWLTEPFLSAP